MAQHSILEKLYGQPSQKIRVKTGSIWVIKVRMQELYGVNVAVVKNQLGKMALQPLDQTGRNIMKREEPCSLENIADA